jgi:thiol-disulfide isomerase/thioredoxin
MTHPPAPGAAPGPPEWLTAELLGADTLGERATLVQFSSAFCQPCRATRRLLADAAALVPGVRHLEIDVADRPDLARLLDVRGTPTVFVLRADGSVARRAAGQPRRGDVLGALAAALPPV